jgi:hypothetical protein
MLPPVDLFTSMRKSLSDRTAQANLNALLTDSLNAHKPSPNALKASPNVLLKVSINALLKAYLNTLPKASPLAPLKQIWSHSSSRFDWTAQAKR